MPKHHKLRKKITTLLTGITLITTPVITSTTAHADTSLRNLNSDMTYLKSSELKEGANDWTSFKDHGVYLFHTVPTDEHGNYKPDKAKLLGKQPDSHGCIRLSVPDAKYINQKVPAETPVTIVEK